MTMGDIIDAPDDFDPDDLPDDIRSIDLDTSAIDEAVRSYQQALETHLLAAWRADFEALDVITPYGQMLQFHDPDGDGIATPAIRGRVRPVEDADADPQYPDTVRVERYDLRDITREDIDAVRGDDHD